VGLRAEWHVFSSTSLPLIPGLATCYNRDVTFWYLDGDLQVPKNLKPLIGNRPQSGYATVMDVAAFLNISKSKVYALMEAGELSFMKLGALRRVPWPAVHALIKRSTRGAQACDESDVDAARDRFFNAPMEPKLASQRRKRA
jgi:excisionase family DNA binding protein